MTASPEYRALLQHLPGGPNAVNTVILRGDPSARPYRIEDFKDALRDVLDIENVAGLGPVQPW